MNGTFRSVTRSITLEHNMIWIPMTSRVFQANNIYIATRKESYIQISSWLSTCSLYFSQKRSKGKAYKKLIWHCFRLGSLVLPPFAIAIAKSLGTNISLSIFFWQMRNNWLISATANHNEAQIANQILWWFCIDSQCQILVYLFIKYMQVWFCDVRNINGNILKNTKWLMKLSLEHL